MAVSYHRTVAPKIMVMMRFEAPIDSGMLRASGQDDPLIRRAGQSRIIRFLFPTDHTQVVFTGRRAVTPVRAKALRWVNKAGVVVFAQRSRAVAPNRWPIRVFTRLGFRNVRVEKR